MDDEPQARPADYVIRLMRDAAKACANDPFRRGNLIELPAQGDVMITGDLHGHLHNFQRIVRIADLPSHPRRHLVLQELLHAMYTDTPDRSHALLEEVAILKNVYPAQVHLILANHDLAELLGLDILKKGRSVLKAFAAALDEAYQFNNDVVRKAYMAFLRTLPWAAATPHGLFIAHSVPRGTHLDQFSRELFTTPTPEPDLGKESPVFRMAWGRDLSHPTSREFARRVGASLVITGHHPCRNGHAQPNEHLVILDCKDSNGAYVILPLGRPVAQDEVVKRIRHLNF